MGSITNFGTTVTGVTGLNGMLRLSGPRFIGYGDSITAGSLGGAATPPAAGAQQQQGAGFLQLAAVLAGDRVRLVHNAGVSGETSAQILLRFARDVAAYSPGIVHVLAGTNDISSASGITLAQTQANIRAIVGLCQSIGATVLLGTVPPKITSATVGSTEIQRLMALNQWLRVYAAENRIALVDYYSLLVDPFTNAYIASYTMTLGGAVSGTITFQVASRVIGGSREVWPQTNATVNTTTGSINFNGTAAQVQSALGTAAGVASAFKVTGAAGGPFTIRSNSGYPFDLTVKVNSLVGGTTPGVTLDKYLSVDGTHPSLTAGQEAMAKALAAELKVLTPYSNPLLAWISDNNNGAGGFYPVTDSTSCVRNGCFLDYDGNGAPEFWTIFAGTVTYTLVPSTGTDNLAGNWLQGVESSSGTYILSQPLVAGTWSVGDTLALSGRVQTSGFEPAVPTVMPWVAATNGFGAGFEVNSSANRFRCMDAWSYDLATTGIGEGWFYQEVTVPAGATSVTVVVLGSGTGGTIRIGQVSVTNLTVQGLITP